VNDELEKFIMVNLLRDGSGNIKCQADDLRALFDGKVLVPVEATRQAWAITHIPIPNEVKGRVMSEMFWRGVYDCQLAMLAASQEQGK